MRQVYKVKSLLGTGNNKTCNWVFENGEVCGKTFSKSYNLVVHMRMHEDVRPFHCSLCDQTFRQKAHLQRHETNHRITCNWVFGNGEACSKTFSKSHNLVEHMRLHADVRPFHCSLCDQTFRQKAHLQSHETTHGIGVKVREINRPQELFHT